MNKKDELFKWIDENTGSGIVKGKIYLNSFYCEPHVLKNKINELTANPHRVKVPAFVADYIDWCKQHSWQLAAIVMPANAEYFESHSEPSGLHQWVIDNYAKFLAAISTEDYDVEEPLYFLKLLEKPVDRDECYLVYEIEEDSYFLDHPRPNNKKYKMQFTEKEIKAIDEGYWPFAIPVEKV